MTARARRGVYSGGVRVLGGTGKGIRVGRGRGYTGTQHAARGEVHMQRSGPRKAHRAWSGWHMELGRPAVQTPPLPAVGPAPLGLYTLPGQYPPPGQ